MNKRKQKMKKTENEEKKPLTQKSKTYKLPNFNGQKCYS